LTLHKDYFKMLKTEFKGYNSKKFSKDLLAGVTVAAVALPLALAFGVSSGASAASGLITAIFAGFIIGFLSGGSYQISGPTGAMTAILLSLVMKYQLQGVFIACFLSGIILVICGLLKLGGLVSFLPLPVITGFTSGIAIIIALGQVNNLTGLTSEGTSTISKITSYFKLEQSFNLTAFIIGASVIIFMIIYPKKLNQYCPASLLAIIFATALNIIFKFDVSKVGIIPKTILLPERLDFSIIRLDDVQALIVPAISIAALGLIESLLCGASAGRMKNEKLNNNQELIAQGVGNMIIPLFGGVPATAAIARTAVAVKSGGQTRLTSIFHAVFLLISMLLLGPVLLHIPLSALAGVLIVTAWRMNEWQVIRNIFKKKIKVSIFQFLLTMISTVIFDLTIAILIGIIFSIVMFIVKVSDMQVNVSKVYPDKLGDEKLLEKHGKTSVAYITGPLYFGTANLLANKLSDVTENDILILSMRGVPFADVSGVQALQEFVFNLSQNDTRVYFTCVQPPVMKMFERCGFADEMGSERFFWSTDRVLTHLAEN